MTDTEFIDAYHVARKIMCDSSVVKKERYMKVTAFVDSIGEDANEMQRSLTDALMGEFMMRMGAESDEMRDLNAALDKSKKSIADLRTSIEKLEKGLKKGG